MVTPGDNPISKKSEDSLGRYAAARSFASHVLSQDASLGVVVGVLGPWGSGKTSLINLARPELEKGSAAVVDFNPWMFSGAEQLVSSFFVEIAAELQLKTGLQEIGKELGEYGEAFAGLAWLPMIGPWIERLRGIAKLLDKLWQRRKQGISQVRKKLTGALSDLDKPIVVILDDIDRLESSEIREVFKLVRLVASFPNVIYLVAFDRIRVEKALEEDGVPGRDYLEKMLLVAVDLPAVPRQTLDRQTFNAIDAALGDLEDPGPFDENAWADVYTEVIRPLIRNMRDVRRYVASLSGTLISLEGKVALVDVLALEAIRVFQPDVFRYLHVSTEALTTPTSGFGGHRDYQSERLKEDIDKLMEASGDHRAMAEAMIKRLFPAAERHIGGTNYTADWQKSWLKKRRIAHIDVLRFYFERVLGEGLTSFLDAEIAWQLMADKEAFDKHLRSLDPERRQDVVSALETFEDEFTSEQVVPGVVVLQNLVPDIPERPQGLFDFDTRLVVGRVTYRLLKSLGDPDAIEAAVGEILPQLASLTAKLEVITDVGYMEGAGHKLVSEAAAKQFEKSWRKEVREASPEQLMDEGELIRILLLTKREATPDEPEISISDSPDMTLAILNSAKSETRSQSMGSRAVRRSPRLAWDVLAELYGDKAVLKARLESLKSTNPPDETELLELADKYASGWRPDD